MLPVSACECHRVLLWHWYTTEICGLRKCLHTDLDPQHFKDTQTPKSQQRTLPVSVSQYDVDCIDKLISCITL